eukprot:TRINITY_DN6829_c0_g1_i1.p1 TRINITY_DN6829_c0_g1~~TRINITY_DN6829_c0_g1_i1.p1  ORF type:complete len:671 (-),score=186.20 TRINITY_DN6829_c0_g1_i1:55-1938(-)
MVFGAPPNVTTFGAATTAAQQLQLQQLQLLQQFASSTPSLPVCGGASACTPPDTPADCEPPMKKHKLSVTDWQATSSPNEMAWSFFMQNEWHKVYTDTKTEVTHDFVAKLDKGFQFSSEDNVWIYFRRNHFQVSCYLDVRGCPTPTPNISFVANGDTLCPVEYLWVHVFGVKSADSGCFQNVELYQTNAKREKQQQQPPQRIPFKCGAQTIVPRLHFVKSTSNNTRKNGTINPSQEFFHVVVMLSAESGGTMYPVSAKMCAPIIVRGCHPGKSKNHSHSSLPQPPPMQPLQPFPAATAQPLPELLQTYITPSPNSSSSAGSSPTTVSPLGLLTSPAVPPTALPPEFFPTVTSTTPTTASLQPPLQQPPAPATTDSLILPGTTFTGSVGINTLPTEALSVVGNISVTGNVFHPSDMRVKQDIQPLDTKETLYNLQRLHLYKYNMKEGLIGGGAPSKQHGVLAQELQHVLPHAVVETSTTVNLANGEKVENLMMVDKDALFMEAVGATLEIAKRVDQLDDTVAAVAVAANSPAKLAAFDDVENGFDGSVPLLRTRGVSKKGWIAIGAGALLFVVACLMVAFGLWFVLAGPGERPNGGDPNDVHPRPPHSQDPMDPFNVGGEHGPDRFPF